MSKYNSSSNFWIELESLFSKGEIENKKIDVVAVSIGPGPFTSVRNAVSVARTISQTTGAKIVSFSLIEVVYKNFPFKKPVILFDGRANKFLVKRPDIETLELVGEDEIMQVLKMEDLIVSIGCRDMVERVGLITLNFDYLPTDMILNLVLEKTNKSEFSNYLEVLPIYYKEIQTKT
ncbi:MAG: hypothetical protein RMJ37_07910 [Spirochaetia bacterium]|nr:hypothetical protein [Spirochaetota bacterium]MCX8096056.1 hypothetical protein [Spirochaetota bacterium]MDW8113238.1 hypothetical protein [Spirochaetia bacterium]